MNTRFVHLRLHTEYSLVDSVIRVAPLMDEVAAADMPAVALTDQSNLFAVVKFYRAAIARGLKPIVGLDAWVSADDGERPASRLILLCQNNTGYRRLMRLVSRSYLDGQCRGVPRIARAWLDAASCEGLIALSGGPQGDVGQALRRRAAGRGTASAPGVANGVSGTLLHRAAADGARGRRGLSARRGGACRSGVRAGGGDQRRTIPEARRFRSARGPGLHTRRTHARRIRAGRGVTPSSSFCAAPHRWRRSSAICRKPWRTLSRLPGAAT